MKSKKIIFSILILLVSVSCASDRSKKSIQNIEIVAEDQIEIDKAIELTAPFVNYSEKFGISGRITVKEFETESNVKCNEKFEPKIKGVCFLQYIIAYRAGQGCEAKFRVIEQCKSAEECTIGYGALAIGCDKGYSPKPKKWAQFTSVESELKKQGIYVLKL